MTVSKSVFKLGLEQTLFNELELGLFGWFWKSFLNTRCTSCGLVSLVEKLLYELRCLLYTQ